MVAFGLLFLIVICAGEVVVSAVQFPSPRSNLVVSITCKDQEEKTHKTPLNGKQIQIINFLAGGIAGCISSSLTMPLEVVKTQLQSRIGQGKSPLSVARMILSTEGPKGMFKGLKPMIVGIIPTRGIYFWAYATSKSSLSSIKNAAGKEMLPVTSSLNHLISAFAAGITSNTITNPLWMVKTRFQIMADTSLGQKQFKNYLEVVDTILKEEGPAGLWKGLTASYIGCFEGAIQWVVYERIKTAAVLMSKVDEQTGKREPLSPLVIFFQASVAKGIAICATYPHEVVRTRLREQASNGAFKYTNFLQCLQTIAKEEGARGLYGGMDIHLLRSVPNAAIMFLSYELIGAYMQRYAAVSE